MLALPKKQARPVQKTHTKDAKGSKNTNKDKGVVAFAIVVTFVFAF